MPLVVMLHGAGGSASWAAGETGWSAKANLEGFIVVYPEAIPPRPDKPSKFLTNPQRWNDGSPFDRGSPEPDDVLFLRTLIESLASHRLVDARRIFVTGFSNGAGMTFRIAAALADRIAAIAPVAGHWWLDGPKPARRIPTRYLIGTADPLIPIAGGMVRTPWGRVERKPSVADTLARWSRAMGVDATDSLIESTFIAGLGHHWPGGKGGLGERIGGPTASPLSATDEIWAFFTRHSLR
jgi:polyhydroxybutyrate depolymerase